MKRNFKSLMSLLVAAVMLMAIAPATFAAPATLAPDAITFYGSGATVEEDVDLKTVLTDGDYFAAISLATRTTAPVADNLARFAKFTQTESGLVFNYSEAKNIKRLDLWIPNCGGVGDYVVEYLDGSTWKEAASGNLDKTDSTRVSESDKAIASYHSIIFDKGVNTTSLRFVIKSFADNTTVAYISEVKAYDHNDINYGEVFSTSDYLYSPYLRNFSVSNNANSSTATGTSDGYFWPSSSKGIRHSIKASTAADASSYSTNPWYATGFNNSKVKVNKVQITLNSGTVSQFKIYAATDNSVANFSNYNNKATGYKVYPLTSNTYKDRWQLVKTIDCDLTTTSDATTIFYIPEAVEAASIMFEFTGCSDNATIGAINMYTVPDSAFAASITDVTFTGANIAAGETLTFSLNSSNNNIPNAKVFFALYEDAILKKVTPAPLALSTNGAYSTTYIIPANATGVISVKAFYLDGVTLVPLLDAPVTATVAQ